jgi:hexulose-6-phosphate isomerase
MNHLTRRQMLATSTAALAGAMIAGSPAVSRGGQFTGKIRKAVRYNMVGEGGGKGKKKQSHVERFQMIKDAGFDGVEVMTSDAGDVKELIEARDKTGVIIHGTSHGRDTDLEAAIDFTKDLGGDAVLVVCRYDQKTGYMENYRRAQASIRAAAPHAEKQKVSLLVENVWASFLIEPLTMARFVDEIGSPWVQCYFDIGNNMRWGYPPHWIEVLGKRIKKVHVKEVDMKKMMNEGMMKGFAAEIGEGSIDWAGVRAELAKVDFHGWASAEVPGGGVDRLRDIAKRMDKVLDLA